MLVVVVVAGAVFFPAANCNAVVKKQSLETRVLGREPAPPISIVIILAK